MTKLFRIPLILLISSQATVAIGNQKYKGEDMPAGNLETATFAGGCFWCMQHPFDILGGVVETHVGYTGGHTEDPAYQEVSGGGTGHTESIEIIYNPSVISYEDLLDVFWRNIDPTTRGRQFVDVGTQYRTAIFYHDEEQKRLAEASKSHLEGSGRFDSPIVTEITPASTFYRAEEYHQKYYEKKSERYLLYRKGTGRDQYLEKIWEED